MPQSNSNIEGQESYQDILRVREQKLGKIEESLGLEEIESSEDEKDTSEFNEFCEKITNLIDENN